MYMWLKDEKGIYSTKFGYNAIEAEKIVETEVRDPNFSWYKEVWNVKASPKSKLLMWKILQGAVATRENLMKRSLYSAANCCRCGEIETAAHLFLHCPYAVQVWQELPTVHKFNTGVIGSVREALLAGKHLIGMPPVGTGNTNLFFWVCQSIWAARNSYIFGKKKYTAAETVTNAIKSAREWHLAQYRREDRQVKAPRRQQESLAHNTWIGHSDAAWNQESQIAGLGWTLKQHEESTPMENGGVAHHVGSPLVAETLALLSAITQFRTIGVSKLIMFSDSQRLIKAINEGKGDKENHGLVHDILIEASLFQSISFNFVSRKDNSSADSIAKESLKNNGLPSPCVWLYLSLRDSVSDLN